MLQNVTLSPTRSRALEFGIYRDGDNNLDQSQHNIIDQASTVSKRDPSVAFTIENTNEDHTEQFTIADGKSAPKHDSEPLDMADPNTLAQFVKTTLDNAEATGAKQTWIELVDHGAGDGGGLEADTFGRVMPMPDIAKAIARGVALHAQEHPEDAQRGVDGVVANQCLMASMGFADALSSAGVKYLAASPETMISPGISSTVAHDIAAHIDDANGMAKAVVSDVMQTQYGDDFASYAGAAAFDVLDLNASKIGTAEKAIKTFNDDAVAAMRDGTMRRAIRDDVASIDGMVRFSEATPDMPWHSDRPAMALYDTIASDGRLSETIRSDARAASAAVGGLILAHDESASFAPFDGSDYRDAVGPTVHAPITPKQIDPWAPTVSETKNRFYVATDQDAFANALA